MKKTMLPFGVFFGLIMSLISGAYRYGTVTFILFIIIFGGIILLSYRVYTILERLVKFIYEKFIKERIKGYMEFKKSAEKTE